ncbi:hypothetical protein [Bifidobacterium miconisargentati]|uniref:hypothetical protein n=1 Tax=Bifidobacterium miconisargentati TaxID=2834437 RepID=UPI001BDDAC9B|nr:hypothetical protein [Bifidobacterium miconisargentati]MBW3090439.1 hypothetical protein [Bifidobacterium miconisargentati]
MTQAPTERERERENGFRITGVTPGTTELVLTAGDITRHIPVTVLEPLNLFPTIPPFTRNGVTVTNNENGTIVIDGTATAGSSWYGDIELEAGRYKAEGCFISWSLFIRFRNPAGTYILSGNGTFTLTEKTTITVHLLINQGQPENPPVTLTPKLTRIGDAAADETIDGPDII